MPNWNVVTEDCDGQICDFDAATVSDGVTRRGLYGVMEIDCDPLLKLLRAQVYDRQRAIADEFVTGAFSEASVGEKVQAWRTQIEDAMQEDPLLDVDQWQGSVDALLADVPNFQDNLILMMSGLVAE